MKVYVVYQENGFGGSEVAEIFSSRNIAREYVIDEIPQWIISSDIAAYHPHTKTIWIRNNLRWKTISILLHELTHWFIHVFLNNNELYHNKIDKNWNKQNPSKNECVKNVTA